MFGDKDKIDTASGGDVDGGADGPKSSTQRRFETTNFKRDERADNLSEKARKPIHWSLDCLSYPSGFANYIILSAPGSLPAAKHGLLYLLDCIFYALVLCLRSTKQCSACWSVAAKRSCFYDIYICIFASV
jgi:hypothetical protein